MEGFWGKVLSAEGREPSGSAKYLVFGGSVVMANSTKTGK